VNRFPDFSLEGKVAVVTGASSGIGTAIAHAYSQAGARVVLVGRDEERLRLCGEDCGESRLVVVDLADDDAPQRIVSETIGSFVLTAGLLMIFANLFWSRFRGVFAGPDPFYGGTLEWTTTSPPPPYNFAVIPTVTSPYPNWDRHEREGIPLDHGHETQATTVRDGYFDEVLQMPKESGWPIVLGAVAVVFFVMLLTSHFIVALMFAGAAGLAVAAWNLHEPVQQ